MREFNFDLDNSIPWNCLKNTIESELQTKGKDLRNNKKYIIEKLSCFMFSDWLKAASWSNERLKKSEKIESHVNSFKKLTRKLNENLSVGSTSLFPIVFNENKENEHFSLLAFRKVSNKDKAVLYGLYVDSAGDSNNFFNMLERSFQGEQLAKAKINLEFKLNLEVYCEAYQTEGQSAIHTWKQAVLLTNLKNDQFNCEEFRKELVKLHLNFPAQVILYRHKMASSLNLDAGNSKTLNKQADLIKEQQEDRSSSVQPISISNDTLFDEGAAIYQAQLELAEKVKSELDDLNVILSKLSIIETKQRKDNSGKIIEKSKFSKTQEFGGILVEQLNKFKTFHQFLQNKKIDYFSKQKFEKNFLNLYEKIYNIRLKQRLNYASWLINNCTQAKIKLKAEQLEIIHNSMKEQVKGLDQLIEAGTNTLLNKNPTALLELKPVENLIDGIFSGFKPINQMKMAKSKYKENLQTLEKEGLENEKQFYEQLQEQVAKLCNNKLWLSSLVHYLKQEITQSIRRVLLFIKSHYTQFDQKHIFHLKNIWEKLSTEFNQSQAVCMKQIAQLYEIEKQYNKKIDIIIEGFLEKDKKLFEAFSEGLNVYFRCKLNGQDTGFSKAKKNSFKTGDNSSNIFQTMIKVGSAHFFLKKEFFRGKKWNPFRKLNLVQVMKKLNEFEKKIIEDLSKIIKSKQDSNLSKLKINMKLQPDDFIKVSIKVLFEIFFKGMEIEKELSEDPMLRKFIFEWLKYNFYSYYTVYDKQESNLYIDFIEMNSKLEILRKELNFAKERITENNLSSSIDVIKIINKIAGCDLEQLSSIEEFLFIEPEFKIKYFPTIKLKENVEEPSWKFDTPISRSSKPKNSSRKRRKKIRNKDKNQNTVSSLSIRSITKVIGVTADSKYEPSEFMKKKVNVTLDRANKFAEKLLFEEEPSSSTNQIEKVKKILNDKSMTDPKLKMKINADKVRELNMLKIKKEKNTDSDDEENINRYTQ